MNTSVLVFSNVCFSFFVGCCWFWGCCCLVYLLFFFWGGGGGSLFSFCFDFLETDGTQSNMKQKVETLFSVIRFFYQEGLGERVGVGVSGVWGGGGGRG